MGPTLGIDHYSLFILSRICTTISTHDKMDAQSIKIKMILSNRWPETFVKMLELSFVLLIIVACAQAPIGTPDRFEVMDQLWE